MNTSSAMVASRNQTIVTPLITAERRPKNVARVSSGIRSPIHRHQPDVPRLAKSQLTARARRMACAPATLLPPWATPRATAAGTKPSTRWAAVTTIQNGLALFSRPKITMERRLNTDAKFRAATRSPRLAEEAPSWFLKKTFMIVPGAITVTKSVPLDPRMMLRFMARRVCAGPREAGGITI